MSIRYHLDADNGQFMKSAEPQSLHGLDHSLHCLQYAWQHFLLNWLKLNEQTPSAKKPLS